MRLRELPDILHGTVEWVEAGRIGGEVAVDPGTGATVIEVSDLSLFPPDGGLIDIGQTGTLRPYASATIDSDGDGLSGTVKLATPTTAGFAVGTSIDLYLVGEPAMQWTAGVLTAEGVVPAVISAPLIPMLAEGQRPTGEGERVIIEWRDKQFVVIELEGLTPGDDSPIFDPYTPGLDNVLAGSILAVYYNGTGWEYPEGHVITSRPSARDDITFEFIDETGTAEAPSFAMTGVDYLVQTEPIGGGALFAYTYLPPATGATQEATASLPDGTIAADTVPAEDVSTVYVACVDAKGVNREATLMAADVGSHLNVQMASDDTCWADFIVTAPPYESNQAAVYAVQLASQGPTRISGANPKVFLGVAIAGPQGPPGDPGQVSYTHSQAVPAAVWSITHPLPFRPNIAVVDSAGDEVEGSVRYTSDANITITFSAAFTGSAYLS